MRTKYYILSISSVLIFMFLTGCYTSLGTIRHHSVYEEDAEYVEEEDYRSVNVYHNYKARPYYANRFVYYDPSDYWYNEPGFYISIGYNHRPYYQYSDYYGCGYPIWHPVDYRPRYVPIWYYDPVHPKPWHAYKKRDFKKRKNIARGRYAKHNKRRNNQDKIYKSGRNIVKNKNSGNYGRRTVSKRSRVRIDKKDQPIIARKNRAVSKRGSVRLPKKSIKNRSIKKKRNYGTAKTGNIKHRQYKKEDSQNKKKSKTVKRVNRRIQTKPGNTKKSYQRSRSINNKNTKIRSKSNSAPKSRGYDSGKNKTSRNSSYSRPKTRENKKTTISKQSKRQQSPRSSYSSPKSKTKSSSTNNKKRRRR